MVWTLKFRAATPPLQPEAHVQIIRLYAAFYVPIFKLQHMLSVSLILDHLTPTSTHLYPPFRQFQLMLFIWVLLGFTLS